MRSPSAAARSLSTPNTRCFLLDAPTDGPTDPRVTLRPAAPTDAADVSRLLAAAFGSVPPELLGRLRDDSTRTLVADLEGAAVGTIRVSRDQHDGGVYGFAVDPARQGHGIGRDILRRVCRQLRNEGVNRIGLEVAVENDRALGVPPARSCPARTRIGVARTRCGAAPSTASDVRSGSGPCHGAHVNVLTSSPATQRATFSGYGANNPRMMCWKPASTAFPIESRVAAGWS